MSERPPSVPETSEPGTTTGSGTSDLDLDALRAVAARWFGPLLAPEAWLALAYLFLGMLAAAVFFVVMVVVAAVTFALSFAVVGLLLVVPAFELIGRLTAAERGMARWVHVAIEPRRPAPVTGIGPRSMRTAMTDPVRWRQVAFVAANLVMAPVLCSIGVLGFAVVGQLLFGANLLPFPASNVGAGGSLLVAVPLAVVALGAAPRLAVWVAERKAGVAEWFLGPDRLAEAEQRVSTLAGSRQDILDAVASERRRIERNLHDGVQQQLVAIGLDLGMAVNHIDTEPERARELVEMARGKVQGSIGELRQLGRGLHPAILADRGLDAALSAVVADSPIPISVHVDPGLGCSTDVAEVLYFTASEAVANILKHARARVASVHVTDLGDRVRITVHDDGVGGADASGGTGLAGISARVRGVDGTFAVTSPAGGPTVLVAELPHD